MAGESYGGRYIPVFAAYVYDQNQVLQEAGLTPINLASVMIGNGLTDFYTMATSYYDMACTPVSVPPVLDIKTCVRMKHAVEFILLNSLHSRIHGLVLGPPMQEGSQRIMRRHIR